MENLKVQQRWDHTIALIYIVIVTVPIVLMSKLELGKGQCFPSGQKKSLPHLNGIHKTWFLMFFFSGTPISIFPAGISPRHRSWSKDGKYFVVYTMCSKIFHCTSLKVTGTRVSSDISINSDQFSAFQLPGFLSRWLRRAWESLVYVCRSSLLGLSGSDIMDERCTKHELVIVGSRNKHYFL